MQRMSKKIWGLFFFFFEGFPFLPTKKMVKPPVPAQIFSSALEFLGWLPLVKKPPSSSSSYFTLFFFSFSFSSFQINLFTLTPILYLLLSLSHSSFSAHHSQTISSRNFITLPTLRIIENNIPYSIPRQSGQGYPPISTIIYRVPISRVQPTLIRLELEIVRFPEGHAISSFDFRTTKKLRL